MLGLYSNCRKRPYMAPGPPLVGGAYGVFRSTQNNTYGSFAAIIHRATDPAELANETAFARTTYDGTPLSCWDVNTDVGSGNWATGSYADVFNGDVMHVAGIRHGLGDWYGGSYGLNLGSLGSIANAASASKSCIGSGDSTTFTMYGITVTDGGFSSSFTYSIEYDGSVIASGSSTAVGGSGASYATAAAATVTVSAFDIGLLKVTITNTSGTTRTFGLVVFGSLLAKCDASNPIVLFSGVHTGGHDAPGITLGDLYRTLTAETAGAGQTYVTCGFPAAPYLSALDGYTTAAATGTHHCDLDELCNTWTD